MKNNDVTKKPDGGPGYTFLDEYSAFSDEYRKLAERYPCAHWFTSFVISGINILMGWIMFKFIL